MTLRVAPNRSIQSLMHSRAKRMHSSGLAKRPLSLARLLRSHSLRSATISPRMQKRYGDGAGSWMNRAPAQFSGFAMNWKISRKHSQASQIRRRLLRNPSGLSSHWRRRTRQTHSAGSIRSWIARRKRQMKASALLFRRGKTSIACSSRTSAVSGRSQPAPDKHPEFRRTLG